MGNNHYTRLGQSYTYRSPLQDLKGLVVMGGVERIMHHSSPSEANVCRKVLIMTWAVFFTTFPLMEMTSMTCQS